ncbi:MAG: transposase [Gammaproteobacteria bacterium]
MCRDVIRQIAMEHEREIVHGKIARGHVQVFLSCLPHQDISQVMQWLKGIQLQDTLGNNGRA